MKLKLLLLTFILIFSTLAYAEDKLIKVAILDNLMSQKLASEKYLEDYMNGIQLAVIEGKKQHLNIQYKSFFYDRTSLSILSEIQKIKNWHPDVVIGPRASDFYY